MKIAQYHGPSGKRDRVRFIKGEDRSIGRYCPWVNFEGGAAWMKSIPIVPVCHTGFRLRELPIPLCLLQGIEATSEGGVKRIYGLVAEKLGCRLPQIDLSGLVDELTKFEVDYAYQQEWLISRLTASDNLGPKALRSASKSGRL
jgi:hypothetical protein